MQLDTNALPVDSLDRVDGLRLAYSDASAQDVLAGVLAEFPDEIALVSSFGSGRRRCTLVSPRCAESSR